jgi:hypothetical protein
MRKNLALLALLALASPALADEGMWTYNGFPKAQLEKKYGVKVDDAWLDHLRLSSVRLAQGCSASFVSPNGLVMTNHHCARGCIQELSTAGKDFIAAGFLARTAADELKCPDLEVNQLIEIRDVTARVKKATAGLEGKAFKDARKAEFGRIESECQTSDALRCEVVTLFHGGRYDLYRYRRHQDVRLVFAPERSIAFFGGDPDNFMFPRWNLDVSFLRVWDGGKPLPTPDFLAWNAAGPKAGDVVFVAGNPGGTDRQLTVAELEFQRDVFLPDTISRYSELRGALTVFQERGPEQKRVSEDLLFGIENSLKVLKGRRAALVEKGFFGEKVAAEADLRKRLAADPKTGPPALAAFASVEEAKALQRNLRNEANWVGWSSGFMTDYFSFARTLVRGAAERAKPNAERLEEFQEARLPEVTQGLFSPAPIYPDFEIFKLTWSLTKLREVLGPDHAFVKKVLGQESPAEMARRLVGGTKLGDPAVRRKLWDGGQAAVDASEDPFILLARRIDPDARAVRSMYEAEVEAPLRKGSETIAEARLAVEGMSGYPDATFTPRVSFGVVKGWTEGRTAVLPFTTFGGAFERNTDRPPFDLPRSWIEAKPRLDLKTPFNFVTTNDIIGGNSGSPAVDAKGRVVGLVFDGNIWSVAGNYGFDEVLNRTVAVDSRAILHALDKVYGATRILEELLPESKAK